jgi:ABC transporter with metal-binding/Fe-S-binding domain ATP-binding protein
MQLAALLSGGKDSMYATYLAKQAGNEIKYVVAMVPENPASYMFHYPNVHFVKYQAAAMRVSFIEGKTKGEKEAELGDLKKTIEGIASEIDGLVSGAVASGYQKNRIDKICTELGLKHIAPLWHQNPEKIILDMIENKFEIIITAVAAPPLDVSWLGRKIDKNALAELVQLNKKFGISVNGEGGEYESFVLNCPLFGKSIKILDAQKKWDVRSGSLEIKKVELE